MHKSLTTEQIICYHCGEKCAPDTIAVEEKKFCCEGCKMVYQILNKTDLCDYYDLNKNPGINQRIKVRPEKFSFLDDPDIQNKIISFKNESETHATFYLPQIHCSSCLYLLENLHKINPGIISSRINFTRKEIDIVLQNNSTSIRKVAETLTSIGYEPYISLNDLKAKRPSIDRTMVYQLGVAGFCFGNIMLLSFPEYLGIEESETGLRTVFHWLSLALAIPVFLYSALPFYTSSVKSIRHRFLNIDTPIALAIIITFVRSTYEIISTTGGGYFDSMAGIVFFMLAGRILQNKTYQQLSFERDYTSYFPIAISVLKNNREISVALPEIKTGDTLLIHNEELIPADGILTKGKAFIDYSFVTGESIPVLKEVGEIVYAGGKQSGGNIEMLTIKEVTQSYLTKLWSRDEFANKKDDSNFSFVHVLSKYFTVIVFAIAMSSAIYWQMNDPAKIWSVVTAVFIIACPCALLLSNSFTNGNILNILSRNRLFLKNATTIEKIASVNHIVFDKTGTLTNPNEFSISYEGRILSLEERKQIAALSNQSLHPLSKSLSHYLENDKNLLVENFSEEVGSGIKGLIDGKIIKIGSLKFVTGIKEKNTGTKVYVSINNEVSGFFSFGNKYRDEVPALLKEINKQYEISILSGDNDSERETLKTLTDNKARLYFGQKPEDKLEYIKRLQQQGKVVMMIGDGLNDAGALRQSDAGVAIAESTNNFTPSSNAIINAKEIRKLPSFIQLCKINKKIILVSFVMSILYNIIGLYFAVQGSLSPMVAAILMPASSLSILLLTFGSSTIIAKRILSKQ